MQNLMYENSLKKFPESKEFLYSPFSKFSAKDTFTFFEQRGLPLVVEGKKRAFPETQKATDVALVMERFVKRNGIEIKKGIRIASLEKKGSRVVSVKSTKGEEFFGDNFAIATGGLAVPETGSTGDGFNILKKLGHAISQPNPNVVPLTTDDLWVHSISGTTLSFMTIRFFQDGKAKIKKTW